MARARTENTWDGGRRREKDACKLPLSLVAPTQHSCCRKTPVSARLDSEVSSLTALVVHAGCGVRVGMEATGRPARCPSHTTPN